MIETVTEVLKSLALSESTTMWVLFTVAAGRGLCATAAEWIPDEKLGGLAGLINLIGGNNRFATGSQ